MTIDIKKQKERLLEEKNKIEQELSLLAVRDEQGIWQAKQLETNESLADEQEVAEAASEFQANSAFVEDLKNQLSDVNEAIVKTETGEYGICIIGGEKIEEDRLEANPSAKTCKAHM